MQFGYSLMDRFTKGHSWEHSGVWWKSKYLQIKTGEKLSVKLLSDVCIALRELYLFSHKAVFEHCSCETKKVIFQSALKTMARSEIFSNKIQKKGSKKLLSDMCIHFTELKRTLLCPVWKLCLWGICKGILSGALEACGEQGNVFQWKLERSFLSNCFVMCVFFS